MRLLRSALSASPWLLAWAVAACSGRDVEGMAVIGEGGGVLEVREGGLAGSRLAVEAGSLSADTRLFVEATPAESVDGFVAVGAAGRFRPEATALRGSLELVFDAECAAVQGNDPAADLVVLRVDHEGWLHVLPPESFDVGAGRVTVAVDGLGKFWVAVRPSDEPFTLADYLPQQSDFFLYSSSISLIVRPPRTNSALVGDHWNAWETDHYCPPPLSCPAWITYRGLYFEPMIDGALRFGGMFQASGPFWVAVDPLEIPPTVQEGESFSQATVVGIPAGAGAWSQPATLRVTFGVRRALEVPAGTFGDVVRMDLELEVNGVVTMSGWYDLARGIGPAALLEFGAGYLPLELESAWLANGRWVP